LRKWHVLGKNQKSEKPTRFIFYDTETTETPLSEQEALHKLKLGVAIFLNVKPLVREKIVFDTSTQFWDFVVKHNYQKTALYIFSHNQHFDFLVVDGYRELYKRGYDLIFNVFESGTFIAKFRNRKEQKTIVVLDLFNYFKTSIEQLGKDLGLPKLKINFKKASREKLIEYCTRDVEIVELTVLKFLDFLDKHDLGNFRYTIASQSMTAFRHRFNPYEIVIHNNSEALKLERESYHGGKNLCFALGTLPKGTTYYKMDINSGYPNVMKKYRYPAKLLYYSKNPTLYTLRNNLVNPNRCVVAKVILNARTDYYPLRQKGKLVFPVGRFTTVLTTEALKHALGNGEIENVLEMAVYEAKPLFRNYVDYFYSLKLRYEKEGNKSFRMFAKYFLNTLSGKFGQQNEKIKKTEKSFESFGYEIIYDLDQKRYRRFFSYGKTVFEFLGEKEEANDSFTAISSHITENQRLAITDAYYTVINNGGEAYYMDTDSLIVNHRGYRIMVENGLVGDQLGQFKVELKARNVSIFGLKDYQFGREVKRKGIRKKAKQINETEFEQLHFPSVKRFFKDGSKVIVRKVKKTLRRKYDKGLLVPEGNYVKVYPYEFKT